MSVTDPAYPSIGADPRLIQTPVLHTSDGGSHPTMWLVQPNTKDQATINGSVRKVGTRQFWIYQREYNYLYLTDGSYCIYEGGPRPKERRVLECRNALNQLEISFDWQPTYLRIAQHQGVVSPYDRAIEYTLEDGNRPVAMHFAGRTWTYEYYDRFDPRYPPLLKRVIPPSGDVATARPGWEYSYENGYELTSMKLPQGGEVRYTYASKDLNEIEYYVDDPRRLLSTQTRVVAERQIRDGDTILGTWTYDYAVPGPDGGTIVTGPVPPGIGARRLTYGHGELLAQASSVAGSSWGVKKIKTEEWRNGQFVEVELDTREFLPLPVIQFEKPDETVIAGAFGLGVPVLKKRIIHRAGRDYTTTYGYASGFGDYHRPQTITETGEATRLTTLTYFGRERPRIIGGPKTETVVVAGETLQKSWEYNDGNGFPKSQTIYGVTTTFLTDVFGNVTQITDANGKATSLWFEYGTPSRIETPAYAIQRKLNLDGTIQYESRTATTAGVGTGQEHTTRFYYDDLFRVTHIELAQTLGGRNPIITTYDPAGRWMKVARGAAFTTTTFDAFGRPTETVNSKQVKTTRQYDADGRVTFESFPFDSSAAATSNIGTSFEYDGLGRVTKRTNSDSSSSTVSYSAGQTTFQDENGNASVDTWQAFGHPDDARVTQHEDAHGKLWQYTYTVAGDIRSLVGPGGLTRTFEYNAKNQLWRETHPESGTATYTFDNVGNVKTKTDALNLMSTYDYDDANRLKKITAGTEITEITYQAGSDNRLTARAGNVRVTYLYDQAGRPSGQQAVINGRLLETKYLLDANDNVQGIIYPSMRRIEYEFDTENRITSIKDKFSGATYASGFAYHSSGAFSDYNVGNGTGFHFTYDPARYWLTDLRAGSLGLAYNSHDKVGNVLAIDDARGSTPWRQTFEYDRLNRLTKATGAYGAITYGYDDHGSMHTGGGASFSIDPNTLRVTDRNGAPFTYFANGNLQSGPFGSYTYTRQNQIATATVNNTVTSYLYDADNWRAMKLAPNSTTYYVRGPGGQLLSELTVAQSTSPKARDYIYAGSRLIATVSR